MWNLNLNLNLVVVVKTRLNIYTPLYMFTLTYCTIAGTFPVTATLGNLRQTTTRTRILVQGDLYEYSLSITSALTNVGVRQAQTAPDASPTRSKGFSPSFRNKLVSGSRLATWSRFCLSSASSSGGCRVPLTGTWERANGSPLQRVGRDSGSRTSHQRTDPS